MKKCMEEISVGNAPKPVNEASHPSGPDNLPSVSGASKPHHLPEKFAPAAVNGEYVDFSDVLSALSVLRSSPSDEGMLRSLSGNLIAISITQAPRRFLQFMAPSVDQIRNGNCFSTTRALFGAGSVSRTNSTRQPQISLALCVHVRCTDSHTGGLAQRYPSRCNYCSGISLGPFTGLSECDVSL